MRVDALGLLANKAVARIADKVVPCGRGLTVALVSGWCVFQAVVTDDSVMSDEN